MSLAQDLVDAVADDLDASGLPGHDTYRYRRPPAITPKMCPCLVVWLASKRPAPLTSERYDAVYTVGVSWHEEVVQEAKTLQRRSAKSTALMDALDVIEARVRALGQAGLGVEAAYQVDPGESLYLLGPPPADLSTGLVDGYALEVVIRVVEP